MIMPDQEHTALTLFDRLSTKLDIIVAELHSLHQEVWEQRSRTEAILGKVEAILERRAATSEPEEDA